MLLWNRSDCCTDSQIFGADLPMFGPQGRPRISEERNRG